MKYELLESTEHAEKIADVINNTREKNDFMFSDPLSTKNSVESIIQNTNNRLFIISENNSYIGFSLVQLRTNIPELAHTAKIQAISLLPEFRGKGYAIGFLQYIIDFLRKTRILVLTLEVVSENKIAIDLYKKLDFIESGCVKKQCKIKDKFFDILSFVKYLS